MSITLTGKKAALVNSDNIVENIIVWDDDSRFESEFMIVVLDGAHPISIGWVWQKDATFIDPNPPVIPPPPPEPTLSELQTQLAELTAKVNKLAGQ
jgi:hypothetical protein